MSLVNDEKDDIFVATYKEIIFIIVVFTIILIILYPKEVLKQQILAEKSNYDLSMLYLKNLLKHHPEDETLMLALAEQSLRSGKKDLSLRLLELLLHSKKKKIRQKAILLSYELKKEVYFYYKTKEKKAKVYKELRYLFALIFTQKLYNEKELDKWYKEAIFIQSNKATYYFLRKKLALNPTNTKELEQAYYFAMKYNRFTDAKKYLGLLIRYDGSEKWQEAYYYMLIQFKKYRKAEKFLKIKAKYSVKWKERLAAFYLMKKRYKKSSYIYFTLFQKEKDYKKKREYFYKAIQALQAGNHLHAAAILGKRYENYYFKDREVREFLLKLYVATGHLDDAVKLSKKILHKEFRK